MKMFFNYPQLAFHLAASSLAISRSNFSAADGARTSERKNIVSCRPQAKYSDLTETGSLDRTAP